MFVSVEIALSVKTINLAPKRYKRLFWIALINAYISSSYVDKARFLPRRAWLKKAIDQSPCMTSATKPMPDASHSKMNDLVKSGRANTRLDVMSLLILHKLVSPHRFT